MVWLHISEVLFIISIVQSVRIWDVKDGSNINLIKDSEGKKVSEKNIYQGDIKLRPRDIRRLKGVQFDASVVVDSKWDTTTVPYAFDKNLHQGARAVVKQAIQEYKSKTCIRLRKRIPSDKNYLYFVKEDGCWSSVGKIGGQQKISLGVGCETKSTAVHEILHALGFWHEQSRKDRLKYIKINWENIEKDQQYNFNEEKSKSFNYPYDIKSVMHYSRGAFSKNGLNTIVALSNPNLKLGQENDGGLSEIDVKQLNAFYCGGDIATTGKPKPSVKLTTTAKPVPVTTSEPYTIKTSTTSEPASAMTPTTETFETSTEWTSSTKPAFLDLGSWFNVHDLDLRFFDDDSYDDTDYIK